MMEISKSRTNQILQSPDPKQFQRYTLDSILFSGDNVSIFQGHENESRQRFIFYISKKLNYDLKRLITQFETCSRVRIYRLPQYEIIQQTFFENNFNDYLNSLLANTQLSQDKVVQIFKELFKNLQEFREKRFLYGNISLNSIIFEKETWKFDIASAILDLYSNNKIFYPFKQKNEKTEIYALGVVVFTCLFGFYPFMSKTPDLFKMKNYTDHLNQKSAEDCSKMVMFLKSRLYLSSQAIDLLQRSLSITRPMTLDEFMNHSFFTQRKNTPIIYNQFNSSQQIKILSQLQPKEVSKVLVAIEKFKTNHVPARRQNAFINSHERSIDNVMDFLRNDQYLSRFQINSGFRVIDPIYYTEHYPQYAVSNLPILRLKYFRRDVDDLDDEYPCRQLIKYIDQCRHSFGHDSQKQALLLRYGFPYAVAFQLLKAKNKQPTQIKQKIDAAVQLLLTVSNLNYQHPIPELHPVQIINQPFELIKPKYRQILHILYKHFLNSAIYKYNTAKKQLLTNPTYTDAGFLKQQGLNAYRICWKLLQASLIMRKQGKQLQLGHMQTSERKQIEIGINNLLSKYFPNKIY